MGWNALNPPKLSDNLIGHIRLNTIKVCKYPMPCRNPNISYLLWRIWSPPDLVSDNSFASTCEACPKFRYKYANVAVPNANPPIEPTFFTSGHNFPATLLPFLKPTTRGFYKLYQVLTVYTNIGVSNMQVDLNNYHQLCPGIMMIDNVTVSRYAQDQLDIINCWCLAATSPQKQIIMMSSYAGTCNTSNVIIPSHGPTLQL
ncbi:hypothetical protein M9H77_02179 [Catharanthus roseus]|uniref:Uncharacterized protein n=1 Tax=Catharanthus roseus TaxID=4058 RepID=A0ACC0C7Y8_CATRO|nr:hypothetical protein M9H77_02179 [Catharanthus roseus]